MRRLFPLFLGGAPGIALMVARFVMGLAFIIHGLPKLQNATSWAGGMGMELSGGLQAIGAGIEVIGGILLIIGLLTPLASIGILLMMVAAMVLVHIPAGHGFVTMGDPSYELPAIYIALSLVLLFVGPGLYSLDAAIFGERRVVHPGRIHLRTH